MPYSPRQLRPSTTGKRSLPQKRDRGQRPYDHRWRVFADRYVKGYPLCVLCICRGRLGQEARRQGSQRNVVVDHIEPFATSPDPLAAMYDYGNLQPLCATCHDRDKQRLERRTAEGKRRAAWLLFLAETIRQNGTRAHTSSLREFLPEGILPVLDR